ncbi:MAG: phenylalanine--tRNA ligase subunit alpha [Bacteroidales bacterium]|jgi:phenylalanyl-tRNA synthetase alpha chain|nr:phenylalanine--tRNA ligase subunit alpha [Bacteroidales bacterium]
MKQKIDQLLEESQRFQASTLDELEQFRVKMLGKKGELNDLFEAFKTVANEEKREIGQKLNILKTAVQDKIDEIKNLLEITEDSSENTDLTRPMNDFVLGSRHPIALVRKEILEVFSRMGYGVAEGPEIEDDWHNFTALNFPPEHPARDMQDTFFVEKNGENDIALRTHTSSVQVRVMETQKPPIRAVFPGRVYRNEAISARAHCFFHQVEGLYIDKNVSFADLRETLLYFAKELFGEETKIRLRPSYFPFTEPSAEMDISCNLCGGKGCTFCKHSGWVEILGCGMIDPNVLENCGIDSTVYSGFAFGLGIERITNLKYTVKDLRLFSENDLRFLSQFKSSGF